MTQSEILLEKHDRGDDRKNQPVSVKVFRLPGHKIESGHANVPTKQQHADNRLGQKRVKRRSLEGNKPGAKHDQSEADQPDINRINLNGSETDADVNHAP